MDAVAAFLLIEQLHADAEVDEIESDTDIDVLLCPKKSNWTMACLGWS